MPIKVSKREQLKKILPSWLKGKEVSTPESPETKTSNVPNKTTTKTKIEDTDEEKGPPTDDLNNNNKAQVQVKLVDLGGHTAMMLVIIVLTYSARLGNSFN